MTSETAIAIAFTWCALLEKVPGTLKKRALAAQYTVLSVPVSTRKNSKSHFLTFSTRLHNLFFAVLIIVPKEACSCDIIFTVEMLVILPLISHWLGNRRIHFLSRSRDQAENKALSKVKRRKLEANLVLVLIWCLWWASWRWLVWWEIGW